MQLKSILIDMVAILHILHKSVSIHDSSSGNRYSVHFVSASKNHKHSMNNPYSQFRDGWSVEQVLDAPKICNQLTKFMCSPTSVSRGHLHSY